MLSTFHKVFDGPMAMKYRGKAVTMGDLMDIHGKIFQLVENMHDLMCRGTKDYREALKNV